MRTMMTLALLGAMVMTGESTVSAQSYADRFTFSVPNRPESTVDGKDPFQLTITRWSTDAERDQVAAVLKDEGVGNLLNAFRTTPAVGHLRWPGGLEYSVRYARRVQRPDGTADVTLVLDTPVWVWWDAGVSKSTDYPFTVIHVRVDKNGKGEGRTSLTTAVAADKEFGVALSDTKASPVLLTDVSRARTDS